MTSSSSTTATNVFITTSPPRSRIGHETPMLDCPRKKSSHYCASPHYVHRIFGVRPSSKSRKKRPSEQQNRKFYGVLDAGGSAGSRHPGSADLVFSARRLSGRAPCETWLMQADQEGARPSRRSPQIRLRVEPGLPRQDGGTANAPPRQQAFDFAGAGGTHCPLTVPPQ